MGMLEKCSLAMLAISLVLATSLGQTGSKPAKVMVAGIEGHILHARAWLELDPLTDPHSVPARAEGSSWSASEVAKFVRIYFPRTYEKLLEFEYMMLLSIETWVFSGKQQRWLHDSIIEGGLGGLQDRSVMSMHTAISRPWAESILSDAFPNDADSFVEIDYRLHRESMRVVINTNDAIPPIFRPYKGLPGVEYRFGSEYGTNLMIPREGAVVTSYSVGAYGFGYPGALPDPGYGGTGWVPHTMYWKYGNGTTWSHQDMIGHGGQYWNTRWNAYAPDMVLAEIIFSTGRELPDDVVLLHRLRIKFNEYAAQRSFVSSLLDFIDRFGANTAPIFESMGSIQKISDDARQEYLDQEYGLASSSIEEAMGEMEGLRVESLRLKDRALIWIYTIEWLAVSGSMLATSFVVWALMIRRRLYREAKATRFS